MAQKKRCQWCLNDKLYLDYHDREWGVPVYDDRILFTFLNLEGMQAGLSWLTILKKRVTLYQAFAGFDPHKLNAYEISDVERLMKNEKIIRNRRKIISVINNARAFLKLSDEIKFNCYLWQFVDYKPIINRYQTLEQVPASTPLSQRISKDLKQRGFSFVGPTIIYAFMQAVGMVNDHIVTCFRYQALNGLE